MNLSAPSGDKRMLARRLGLEGSVAAKSIQYLGNIWILETSVAYRREVARYLDLVRTTRSGRTLIKFINQRPRWMLIMPFKPTAKDPVNAYAYPKSENETDAYPQYYLLMKPFKLPNGIEIQIPTGKIGTGVGAPVYLDYHPATWRQLIANTGRIAPGTGPGEILFHEMTHGYRMQSGLLRDDKVAANPAMDNIEELYAILASNVYRSERGFTSLRTDHWGFSKIKNYLTDSELYYEEYKKEIDDWFASQRAFCLEMAAAPATFNPFREAAIAKGLMQPPTVPMRLGR